MRKMINKICLTLFACAMIICLPMRSIQALGWSLDEKIETSESYQYIWSELMTNLYDLDQYQVNFRIVNKDEQQLVTQGKIIGNQISGNARFIFEVYPQYEEGPLRPLYFDMLTYRNFELVYINLIQILNQTGYFEQGHLRNIDSDQLENYSNYMIKLDNVNLNSFNPSNLLLDTLIIRPSEKLIESLDDQLVTDINGMKIIHLQRLEIPRGIFDAMGKFMVDFRLDLNLALQDQPLVSYLYQTDHNLFISKNNSSFQFNFAIHSKSSPELVNENLTDTPKEEYQYSTSFDSKQVTQRLTEALILFNSKEPSYHVSFHGLSDQFSLNIFDSETADFEVANYVWEYDITANQEKIPLFHEIQSMTMSEFSFLIEELLTQNIVTNE